MIIVAYLIIFCKVTLSTCDSVWYKLVLVMLVTLSRSILWWRSFQKLVVHTNIDIYVFIVNIGMTDTKSFSPLFINVLHFNLLINHWTIEIFAGMICKLLHFVFKFIPHFFPNSELDTTLCDKVCQWLATGRWCSPSTPVSSTN